MTLPQKTILAAALVAAWTTPWLMHQQARSRLREEIQTLRQQVACIPQLQTEQARLSNLVARVADSQADRQAELRDLGRLRRDVGFLRQQTNELARLAQENLRNNFSLTNDLTKALIGNAYSRESWAFAGYDTPEAALQSFVWASRSGDWENILAGTTPRYRAWIEAKMKDPAEKIAEGLDEFQYQTKEIRITDAQMITPDFLVLHTWFEHFDEHGYGAPLHLRKIEGQWKIDEPNADDKN